MGDCYCEAIAPDAIRIGHREKRWEKCRYTSFEDVQHYLFLEVSAGPGKQQPYLRAADTVLAHFLSDGNPYSISAAGDVPPVSVH
jgi:hypothetical protein